MHEKDSFRKKNLLTKIENLIAKKEAERDNLPDEEYKSNAQYIQGFLAGLDEARRIVKGLFPRVDGVQLRFINGLWREGRGRASGQKEKDPILLPNSHRFE